MVGTNSEMEYRNRVELAEEMMKRVSDILHKSAKLNREGICKKDLVRQAAIIYDGLDMFSRGVVGVSYNYNGKGGQI